MLKPVLVGLAVLSLLLTTSGFVQAEEVGCRLSFENRDYAMAQDLCKKQAAAGDEAAQYLLAKGYLIGAFGKVELDKAISIARSCESMNAANCANVLGLALRQKAVPEQLWQSMPMTTFRSVVKYSVNEKLLVEANEAFLKAANNGGAKAMYNIGVQYFRGLWIGFESNSYKAIEWGKKASDAGFIPGNLLQADVIITDGLEEEYPALVSLLLPSVKMDSRASYLLARVYELGLGVPKSSVKTYAWLTVAGAQGNADATVSLGNAEESLSLNEMSEGRSLGKEYFDKYAK